MSASKKSFLVEQDYNIAKIIGITPDEFYQYFQNIKDIIIERSNAEIQYYEREIERVNGLNREEAIEELLKTLRIDSKIATIRGFIAQINERDLGT
ncbi:MAG: HindIII family type II restriction endonuclease [Candidatus Amulumruptor caecigallinarius]|nr:HindIII family type II restriction endonuclease [Candidatus Amulumruptor caecigallinarius]MCM1397513.1 HindIII family type II restriction endonuclease [Candidatus Amulumruptor caecigallinarius]MCM1454415.1 HindIII family type II restriction endonuclease [bacterium]